jgi:hypothetical protein
MPVNYYKDDKRVIRIEPNPFKTMSQKVTMRTKKMSGGQPVISQDGKHQYKDEVPQNLTRIPGTSKRLVPSLTSNGVNTGLNEYVENEYKNESVYKVQWAERILKDQDKVLLQHVLEYELGFDFDYLTNRITNGIIPSAKEDKKFYEKVESRITLDGGVTFLYMNNPVHRVLYYMLLAHPKIANSYAELEDGMNNEVEWFIADSDEKEKIKLTRIEKETKAAAALEDLNNHESDAVMIVAKALDIEEASDRSLTKTKATRMIYDYYNSNNDSYDNFMKTYQLWRDQASRNWVVAASELFEYHKAGVVSYRNGKYTWTKRGQGGAASESYTYKDKNDFIRNFILDPAYQEEVAQMEEEYNAKTK